MDKAQIYIAEEAGACFGVNRALEMVRKAAEATDEKVYTWGPLIHNPLVVKDLEDKGVAVAKSLEDAKGKTILLRTHGVTPKEELEAAQNCSNVIDATCPFVVRAHRAAEELAEAGYTVLIYGEEGHPEVLGTLGHAPEAKIVSSPEDLLHIDLGRKVGIVVQTTQSRDGLKELVAALIGEVVDIRVIDTICEATTLRQRAAKKLSAEVDVMIVIGGRISANTTRLAEICSQRCPKTHHIERVDELQKTWFEGAQKIGITAGASTPQDQIDEVHRAIEGFISA